MISTALAVVIESSFKIGPNFDGTNVNPKGWGLNVPAIPDQVVATPDFGLLGSFNLFGSFDRVPLITALLLVFTLLLADFFDTMEIMVNLLVGQSSFSLLVYSSPSV